MFKIQNYELNINEQNLFKINNLSLINNGHIVICGEIGCGKSTFAKSLIGFKEFDGSITYEDEAVNYQQANSKIAYIPQNLEYYFIMANVLDEIKFSQKISNEECLRILNKYNLAHTAKQSPQVLSGGEKVRLVALLCELNQANCLILDETVAMNDYENTKLISHELEEMMNAGTLIIEISHDIERIRRADQIIFIDNQIVTEFRNFNDFEADERVAKVWGIHD